MADISVIDADARFTDGHIRLGVAAGDHAVAIWPLLCGMAKAKYLLMTADFIDGREAERIGLVSKAVTAEEVLPEALRIAATLATGPTQAIRMTKRALNHWLRQALPAFEASLAYEMLNFLGPDAAEGLAALQDKRPPRFQP
jgi:enoyl-CoA hydratase